MNTNVQTALKSAAENEQTLSIDSQFDLLANARRRAIIRVMADHDGPTIAFRDLVDRVAELECDTAIE
ncbi:hypothetical protein ACKC5Q_23225, partial [Aeromonas dhakensis]|uniref:DUF7344 domain-containing protein n=1 Tax=Aeromonas dhakensis TaxID=196024 RepID=UPI0038B52F04